MPIDQPADFGPGPKEGMTPTREPLHVQHSSVESDRRRHRPSPLSVGHLGAMTALDEIDGPRCHYRIVPVSQVCRVSVRRIRDDHSGPPREPERLWAAAPRSECWGPTLVWPERHLASAPKRESSSSLAHAHEPLKRVALRPDDRIVEHSAVAISQSNRQGLLISGRLSERVTLRDH